MGSVSCELSGLLTSADPATFPFSFYFKYCRLVLPHHILGECINDYGSVTDFVISSLLLENLSRLTVQP